MVRKKLAKKYDRQHEVWFHIDLNDSAMDMAGWVRKLRAMRSPLDAVQIQLPTAKTDGGDELALLPLWAALSTKHFHHLHVQGGITMKTPSGDHAPHETTYVEWRLACLSLALAELPKTLSTLSLSAVDFLFSSPEHSLAEAMGFEKALKEQWNINRIILSDCRIATDLMGAAVQVFIGDGTPPNLEVFDRSLLVNYKRRWHKRVPLSKQRQSTSPSSLQLVALNLRFGDAADLFPEAILECCKSSSASSSAQDSNAHHRREIRLQTLAMWASLRGPGGFHLPTIVSNVPFLEQFTLHTAWLTEHVYSGIVSALVADCALLESITFRLVNVPWRRPARTGFSHQFSGQKMERMLDGDPTFADLMRRHNSLKGIHLIGTGGDDMTTLPPMIQFYISWNRVGRALENASLKEQEELLRHAHAADSLNIWFSLLAKSPMLLA